MTQPPKKPAREFWLQIQDEYSTGLVSGYFSSWDQPSYKPIHVIEYSEMLRWREMAERLASQLKKEMNHLVKFDRPLFQSVELLKEFEAMKEKLP